MKNQMSSRRVLDEHSMLFRVLEYRLPNRFKMIGILGATLIFLFLIGYKFSGSHSLIAPDVLRTLILLFLLIASLSKDIIEDEYSRHVRFQSYVIAFVSALVYCISIPLIALVLDLLITSITGDGSVSFYEISAFEVMFILVGFQLLFFETLKRFGCAE